MPLLEGAKVAFHARALKKLTVKDSNAAEDRRAALKHIGALAKIGSDKAMKAIGRHALSAHNYLLASYALAELERTGGKAAAEAIVEHGLTNIATLDIRARRKAGHDLVGGLPDRGMLDFPRKSDSREGIHAESEQALTRMGWVAEKALIKHGLAHKDGNVVLKSTIALGKMKSRKAVMPIIKRVLNWKGFDPTHEVKRAGILALGLIRDKRAAKPIIELMRKHPNKVVLTSGAFALGSIRDKRAAKPLLALVKHHDTVVVREGLSALGRVLGKRAVPVLVEIGLAHPDPWVIYTSAVALGLIGDKRALPHLMRLADHENEDVRMGVRQAIHDIQKHGGD
jgi:hypothetical protein